MNIDLEIAKSKLSKTQKVQLNGMLRKMGYDTIKWEDFNNDRPRNKNANIENSNT